MTIYFTADTHFSHKKIINYCNRPFATIEEHDRALLNNWITSVKKGDTVYFLGDFGFSPFAANKNYLTKLANKLTGNIIFIRGNHDTNLNKFKRFNVVKDVHTISYNKQKIFLSHYAHRTWPFMHRGGYHLFGHSHANLPSHGKSFDIGVDNAFKLFGEYRPISIDEVFQVMSTLSFNGEEPGIENQKLDDLDL